MRQTRLTIKRRRQMKRNLYIKPLVTVYIAFLLLALTVDGTAAKFNDITSVEGAFQVGEWTPDIPDDGEGWDKSSLTFEGGANGSCEQITATVKNTGEDMTSPWKYHVYRAANLKGKPDWQRISGFEGKTELLGKDDTDELTFNPDKNGRYRFKFVRPDGHPGGDNGGKSGAIKLKDCEEEQSANSKDERRTDKKENNNGNGQKDRDNNNEQKENKVSSNDTSKSKNNQESDEENVTNESGNDSKENTEDKQQESKDQDNKDEETKEGSEDSSTDASDEKEDQQNTKSDQQQDPKQEKETSKTDSTDDKQQEDQTSKTQDSKDDDTQVKEEESSNDNQNEND
ncbi:amyloid fiber anchoring/assembly protein TapA [Alkalibacillus salilacus]|uniref:YqxM protein n=1 Tax=Alkalibacillus salilacus TaxID=284582 RepID=A0ABT9VAY0_9BACI|nr:amyloid fiber anchoring/assembly protein TapA [Alkalibacillus salilacus]MDQ0158075.1 YqxM protein [Alkalibacillus salilacus]